MTDKFNNLCALTIAILLLTATTASSVETLKPEDEDILTDIVAEKTSPAPVHQMVRPVSNRYTYSPSAPRKVEWFNPKDLPTNQPTTKADPRVTEFRALIEDCQALRQDRLDLECEMLALNNTAQNAAYLSQTVTEINLCYEDLGYDIIETFYDRDITTIKNFSKKAKTFYVTGTNASFDPRFCGENCTMQSVVAAQLAKFAEFRTYLNQLIDERPTKE